MPLENGLDDRLITSSDLQQYFVNKANGEANAGGSIRFWVDTDRTTPKDVYELVQDVNTGNYSYVPLPNPLTLSGVGTVVDSSNNDIPIYWFPYDHTPTTSNDNLELYYVEVLDANGQLQFTREAWPYPLVEGGNVGPTISSLGIVNQLSNPQFTKVLFQEGTSLVIAVTGSGTTTVDIAPDWTLSITHSASGNVTVTQTAVAGTSHLPYNPPFTLSVAGNAFVTDMSIYQQLNNNPDWAAPSTSLDSNGFLSGSILLSPGTGVTMQYVPSAGNAAQTIISTTNNTTAYKQFDATVQLQASNNPDTGITGYDRIVINFSNPTGTSIIGNVQVVPLTSNVEGVLFEQSTANRQLDQMFNYYKAGLDFKPTQSYLIGWDFPLNPVQVLGPTIAAFASGANTSNYFWDQTIVFQSANSGVSAAARADGALVLTAAATTQLALIQYLDGGNILTMLQEYLSCNLRAFTDQIGGIPTTISLWYTKTAIPNVASGTNQSIVATLNSNGKPATFNGTWTEIARSNLGDATFTMVQGTDYSDYGFARWLDITNGATTGAAYFAIVVGFGSLTSGNKITIQSISCVPGVIPTRPAALSAAQNLLSCQRYYWSTFASGIPRQNAGFTNAITYTCQIGNTTAGYTCTVTFPATMREGPIATFYNPGNTNANWRNQNGTDSGAASASPAFANPSTPNMASIKNLQAASDAPNNSISVHASFDARLGIV